MSSEIITTITETHIFGDSSTLSCQINILRQIVEKIFLM